MGFYRSCDGEGRHPLKRIIVNEDERVGTWISERTDGEWRAGGKCIGLEQDGKLIAGVLYDWYNGASVYAHIAIDGTINREFLWFIFHYPFEQLNVNVIIGLVAESNKSAINLDTRLGFTITSRIPDGHPDGDLLIFTMTKHQCKWLRVHEQAKTATGT